MLNISLPACTKAEIKDSTFCIAVDGVKFQSDLDLGLTMPNMEPV